MPKPRGGRGRGRRTGWLAVALVIGIAALGIVSVYLFLGVGRQETSAVQQKPIILYVNQGNGIVNGSGFGRMLEYASSNGFNTVFFQVYREGHLLFSPATLQSFVNQTHRAGLKMFFALYITDASQALPVSVFGLREDGVSLDMSTVSLGAQQSFLGALKSDFKGQTAVTTIDMFSPLKPDLLVLETYGKGNQQYIRAGIVASVGVFATSDMADYQSQFEYALQNSDGVMVFDYYGLQKAGY
ncbi:MAG TPA: hypothetical protein VKF15_00990 [Nitrososphaerales archaeon]|nr:hypothetical protein [Nitrososphaerales archaeon]